MRGRQFLGETAHLAHVLLLVHRVNDAACSEEQQGLEEGVRDQVKDARRVRTDAHGQEHVAQLRDRAEGQDLFDVVLVERADGAVQRGRRPDDGHQQHGGGRRFEERKRTRDQIDARGDHSGRVNERRHRGRARHRVGQPGGERQLRALACCADQQKEADQLERGARRLKLGAEQLWQDQRPELGEDQEHRQHEAQVTDAVHDEGFTRRVGVDERLGTGGGRHAAVLGRAAREPA